MRNDLESEKLAVVASEIMLMEFLTVRGKSMIRVVFTCRWFVFFAVLFFVRYLLPQFKFGEVLCCQLFHVLHFFVCKKFILASDFQNVKICVFAFPWRFHQLPIWPKVSKKSKTLITIQNYCNKRRNIFELFWYSSFNSEETEKEDSKN